MNKKEIEVLVEPYSKYRNSTRRLVVDIDKIIAVRVEQRSPWVSDNLVNIKIKNDIHPSHTMTLTAFKNMIQNGK